jgi:hypothetical protein
MHWISGRPDNPACLISGIQPDIRYPALTGYRYLAFGLARYPAGRISGKNSTGIWCIPSQFEREQDYEGFPGLLISDDFLTMLTLKYEYRVRKMPLYRIPVMR